MMLEFFKIKKAKEAEQQRDLINGVGIH